MPWGVELSSDVKGQIIGMSNSNKSARQISRELNIPHSTISYTIERFRKTGSNNNLPWSRRPSLLTERNMNMLGRTIKKNRFTPLKEVINQLPITVNVRTAWNALKEHNINLYTATKNPISRLQTSRNAKIGARKSLTGQMMNGKKLYGATNCQ